MPFDSTPRIALFFSSNPPGDLQLHAVRGHDRAGQAEHADQPRPGIGRAADDLQRLAIAGVYAQHLQLVGIGVPLGGQHPGDAETGELFGGVLHPFDLKPDGVELGRDLFRRGGGVEVVLEPGKRELHATAPTPAERVGTSSGEKP